MTITAPSAISHAVQPGASWPATNEVPVVESFLGEIAVRSLDDAEFTLLLRVVDAVIRSQAFSLPRLRVALCISDQQAELMTSVLEALGIVTAGSPIEPRAVVAALAALPIITSRLTGCRLA